MGARRYEVSRTIEAPAERIWSLLTDADGYSSWNEAVIDLRGTIREGERIRLVSVADPKRTFKLTVEEMSAPDHMVWTDGMPLGLFRGRRTYSVRDHGSQRSSFTMVEEFSGLLVPLITRAIPDLTDSFDRFADSLKVAAESAAKA